jgi:hypothetical protein
MKKIQIIAGILSSILILYISLSYYFSAKYNFFLESKSPHYQKTTIDIECQDAETNCINSINKAVAENNEINVIFNIQK